ncbi:hypothetical protein P3S67_006028 [Capsicum chacoense]
MKNVAKCDTWCELQNPVNHRVFERKLRPKPLGRGHVCLGVTHRVAPLASRPHRGARCRRGADTGLPCASSSRPAQMRVHVDGRRGKWWLKLNSLRRRGYGPSRVRTPGPLRAQALRPRPQVRRDYPLSLSISISGGKETYKDSLSNGERTGNSPALESGGSVVRIVVWRSVLSGGPGPSPLEGGAGEGESPVVPGPCRTTRRCLRVGLFGNAAQIGR